MWTMAATPDLHTPAEANPSRTPLSRRTALTMLGLGGLGLVVAACGGDDDSSATTSAGTNSPATTSAESQATTAATADTTAAATADTSAATTAAAAGGDLTETPEETGGPFPSDGSNDNGEGTIANILADSRSVRSDIRSDLDGSNTQEGVPFALTMNVVDAAGAAVEGAAVYIWHCTKDGGYSQYDSQMIGGDFTDRSYLRGVQIAGADGSVAFQSILPGRYQGRAFHIHFEVYSDSTYSTKLLTSQMAIDDDLIDQLYADAGYDDALGNDTDNANDGVFGDGVEHQLLTVTGDVASGLTATFTAVV